MASNSTEKNSALRFTDIGTLANVMLAPIEGYGNLPLVSLEEAVKELIGIVPKVERNVYLAKQSCQEPRDGLTTDESASIMLYTFESKPHAHSLYVILNTTLRSPQRVELLGPLASLFTPYVDRTDPSSITAAFCTSGCEGRFTKTISNREIYHLVGILIMHHVHWRAWVWTLFWQIGNENFVSNWVPLW